MAFPGVPGGMTTQSGMRPGRNRRAGDLISSALAAGQLGAGGLVFFALSAGTPLTVVAGVVTTGFAVTGETGIPAAFVLVGVVLGVFAVGYMAMARHITNAGAFYAYISRGLNRPLGMGAAWLALVSYCMLQVALYGAIGSAGAPLCEQYFHATPPWWVFAGLAWMLTAGLGLLKVGLNGKVLAVLLVAEVAVIVVYSVADIVHPATGHLSAATLSPHSLVGSGAGALLALAVLGFIGFESTVVFTEETRKPRVTVPKATFACIAITAVLYTVASWAMSLGAGPDRVVADSRASGTDLIFSLAGDRLGTPAADIGHILFVGSVLAALISFHNTTARYLFALGRERVLPGRLGGTSVRTGSPVIASAVQSTIGLIVIITFALAGWDPLVQLFYWGGTIGGIGVLTLLAMTSFSVIGFFARTGRASRTETGWATRTAPAVAGIALVIALVLALRNLPTLLGVRPGHPLVTLVPAGIVAILALGMTWAQILRVTRPDVYQSIGLGPASSAVRVSPSVAAHEVVR